MKDVKERLKGTCVLNESVEMGAEIVALYTEAGLNNILPCNGSYTNVYYGVNNNDQIYYDFNTSSFKKVLTLDQLREIVRWEKQTVQEYEKQLEDKFVSSHVEFKEGEMVEVTDDETGNGTWHTRKYAGFLLNRHWVFSHEYLYSFDYIRKIDKDKELKEIAKPILEKWDLLPDGKCDPNVLCAMIEAMKKVQSKK